MSNASTASNPQSKLIERFTAIMADSPALAECLPDKALIERATNPDLSLTELIDVLFSGYGNRVALAERAYSIEDIFGKKTRQYLQRFSGITYAETLQRLHRLADAWQQEGAHKVSVDDFVCIVGFASIDYQVIDMACHYVQAVTVPLQSATSGADLDEIFENINPTTIAATVSDLEVAAQHAIRHGDIKSLIVFDYEPLDTNDLSIYQEVENLLAGASVSTELISLQSLTALGDADRWSSLPAHKDGGDRLGAIVHSSGSTGKPKGAMLAEKALRYSWEVFLTSPNVLPNITVTYAPLNHLLGRSNVVGALVAGGVVNFTLKPDMSTLFDDIRITEPTRLSFFPRVFELIYQHYQNEVAKRVRAGEEESAASEAVKQHMGADFLGRRLLLGIVGGAPTAPAVKTFMTECFDMMLMEGYGNTESGSGNIAVNGMIQRPPVTEYKLRDVPELGYYTSDKPYPRGELCYKSAVGITGYYKQQEATAGLFDEDGFSLTGDIVEERGPDHIVVIDRRKDVLKLSQGEYVAVGNLATQFESGSAVIKQIYLYGNSFQSYLLGVVVPDVDAVSTLLGEGWIEADLTSLIRDELQRVASEKDLKSFEVPRSFIIEYEAFSQENGLLSSVRKRLSPALKKKYGERLEAMYEEHANRKDAELQLLKDPSCTLSTPEKVGKLLESSLNIENIDISSNHNFSGLGGDSLAAVSFSLMLEEVFSVTIAADVILRPTGNIAVWSHMIEQALLGQESRPTFDAVHGKGAEEVHAKDLQLDRFFDEQFIKQAEQLPNLDVGHEKTIFLTGANGYLGRFVCLRWLQKMAAVGGKVICLIRAEDTVSARRRLDAVFAGDKLEQDYHHLATEHLEVLCGDVADEQFGLEQDEYHRLTTEVDRIVHVAALVNHMMGYKHLFTANVVGTAEVIKLGLSSVKKPIDFVSTVGIGYFLDTRHGNNEESPLVESTRLEDFYAYGYGLSKWAGEKLLQQANQRFGMPVNIFRGDMMLAHETYKGQINKDDMFTRLLLSIIRTGLAPKSFYQLDDDGQLQQGHYNGVPVNTVADTIVAGGAFNPEGYKVFNISNFHTDDGESLDQFVRWMAEAGYPITLVASHKEWVGRFEQKMKMLPETLKQKSVLSLMGAFSTSYPIGGVQAGCDNFKALLKQELSTELPHLNQVFINKCLTDMREVGLIDGLNPMLE
ncbi:carboxylic acid reductase [Maricurvus nonylphenolicus]|uniref:thioester reductase domain-containing protein n=1 Tax=Maricurvus nonylphenolicus TaxID=1008307 RepID=UPI0036F3A8F6